MPPFRIADLECNTDTTNFNYGGYREDFASLLNESARR